jgi:hypothetical protein
MTRSQYDQLVKQRTELILGSELAAQAYVAHFETQLRRRRVRTWLRTAGRQFARGCVAMFGHYPDGIC